jgi:DNA-binding transcriptional LysR family regulator
MRHLRIYRAIGLIAREGSIRKAADLLTISPSALNRSVLAFEEELGIEIFERLPGGVRLSVAGELLFRHTDEHLSRMDDYFSLISEMKGGGAGTLRLSVSGDLSETLLPEILARFRRQHPGIEVVVEEAEGPERLVSRRVDLALVTWPQTEPGVEVVHSHSARIVGRVARDHPRAGGRLSLSDLSDHTLILPPDGTGLRGAADRAMRRNRADAAATMIYPRLVWALATGDLPDLQLELAWHPGLPETPHVGHVDLTAMRFQPVQITLLRRSEGHPPRPAELFTSALHRFFDQPDSL